MTASPPPAPSIISFGDHDGRVWGCLLEAGEPLLVVASPDGTATAHGADVVSLSPDDHGWRLGGPGVDLLVAPAEGDPGSDGGSDELCTVSGSISPAGSERAVDAVGTAHRGEPLEAARLDSLRSVSGWFDGDDGVTLLALRPFGQRDQERDLIVATLFAPDGPVAVDDPRLSTTYLGQERPDRASLELWIGDGEEQYPRRAAAEARGEAATLQGERVHLTVTPMRCHKAGREGSGVYVLARFSR